MNPRFSPSQISALVERYWTFTTAIQRDREDNIINVVAPAFRERGRLTKQELLLLAHWKSPRTQPRIERNAGGLVEEVTGVALSTTCSEELRIKILTILDGVQSAVASVVLHFAFPDQYPILDFRALWSLEVPEPEKCTFEFWKDYTEFCRTYIHDHNVSMRDFDRALWAYSKDNQ